MTALLYRLLAARAAGARVDDALGLVTVDALPLGEAGHRHRVCGLRDASVLTVLPLAAGGRALRAAQHGNGPRGGSRGRSMATDPAGTVEGLAFSQSRRSSLPADARCGSDSSQSRRSLLPAGARCGSDLRKAMCPGSSSPWHCGRLRVRA
ncbi:hypothetical protein T492DRAFT_1050411 [Pavlovales sp. CCMP2436]|nr:hypothetical protein T492DRAFT_1050411 [Pavlovales sp. CCMP2436]